MIVQATKEDLPQIANIYNQAIKQKFCTANLQPLDETYWKKWFDFHSSIVYPIFVYKEDTKVIGWISFSPYRPGREALNDVIEISFYIDFNYHRRGIGSELIQFSIEEAKKRNIRIFLTMIIEGNIASITLLKKYGFEQWAYIPKAILCNGEKRAHIYLGINLES